MNYTTVSAMCVNAPVLGSASTLTSAHLATFAGYAESVINANLASRYTVPVSGAPDPLPYLATELACAFTMQRVIAPDMWSKSGWEERRDHAMSEIRKIAKGDVLLVTSGAIVDPSISLVSGMVSNTQNYLPVFDPALPIAESCVDYNRYDNVTDERDC